MSVLDVTRGASLYVVITEAGIDVQTRSMAPWHVPQGGIVTLDPVSQRTAQAIQQNLIGFAPAGAADNSTPAAMVRGQAGLHTATRN
jgi:hypothetical protein